MKCDTCGDLYVVKSEYEVTARPACRCETKHKCSFQKRGSPCGEIAQVVISPYDATEILEWRCYKHAIEDLLVESVKYRELLGRSDQADESLKGLWIEEMLFVGERKVIKEGMNWFKRKVRCVACDKTQVLGKRRLVGSGCSWWNVCSDCGSERFAYLE